VEASHGFVFLSKCWSDQHQCPTPASPFWCNQTAVWRKSQRNIDTSRHRKNFADELLGRFWRFADSALKKHILRYPDDHFSQLISSILPDAAPVVNAIFL
jgi:hypothetical protein